MDVHLDLHIITCQMHKLKYFLKIQKCYFIVVYYREILIHATESTDIQMEWTAREGYDCAIKINTYSCTKVFSMYIQCIDQSYSGRILQLIS